VLAVANRWDVAKLEPMLKERYRITGARADRLLAQNMQAPVNTTLLDLGSPVLELAFVGIPGEPFVEFQMQLRAKSPLPNSFLLGYTNGYFAYLPAIAAAGGGGCGGTAAG